MYIINNVCILRLIEFSFVAERLMKTFKDVIWILVEGQSNHRMLNIGARRISYKVKQRSYIF